MDWSSAVVSLGGLFVGAMGVFLTYRSRLSPFSQALYERRLDAYAEVVRRLGEFHDDVIGALAANETKPLDVRSVRERTRATASAMYQACRNSGVFLEGRINDAVTAYLLAYENLPKTGDPTIGLRDAFARVSSAAKKTLGAEILSIPISALTDYPANDRGRSDDSAMTRFYLQLGFENEDRLGSAGGEAAPDETGLLKRRDDIYQDDRNLFLVHTWHQPSRTPGQLADISIRLAEHKKQRGPLKDVRPLSNRQVEKVEYNLGSSWFRGEDVAKTNAEDGFRLDVSAYSGALCLARIHFTDGKVVVLQRYLDFPEPMGEVEPE
ncbi:MAG: pYEATS domain-containing protein [Actinomycetota bacterium]